ncbi:MAG: transcription initiation factor IIB [Elusimicrobiota bacterium]
MLVSNFYSSRFSNRESPIKQNCFELNMSNRRFYQTSLEEESQESENRSRCCDDPTLRKKGFQNVCTNCGTVHGKNFVSLEKRAYTAQEVKNRRRTEPRWRKFGPRTTIPKSKASRGKKGAKRKVLFSRLSKIQQSLISSIERNFWEARPKLKMLASKLNIPAYIKETAWKIYSKVARKKLTMGRSIRAFVAGSIYAAIRVHEFPRILEEICDAAMISIHKVHQALGLIVKEVLPELGLKYHPITSEQLIFRFGNTLDLSMKVQKKALDLLKESSKKGLRRVGKDPRGFSAGALYISGKMLDEWRTQKDIAGAAGITEVTLRSRIKDLKKNL